MIFFIDEMKNLHTLKKFTVIQQMLTKKKWCIGETINIFSSKLQKISSKKSFLWNFLKKL